MSFADSVPFADAITVAAADAQSISVDEYTDGEYRDPRETYHGSSPTSCAGRYSDCSHNKPTGISCGHCQGRHNSPEAVYLCSVEYLARRNRATENRLWGLA